MKIRVQARQRVDLGVAMMVAIMLLLGAQQFRLEAEATSLPTDHGQSARQTNR
jgi:hypothetical protein